MSKNMLRNQAFHRDSLEVISDWRLLTFCSVLFLRNTVLIANMFRRSLFQAFGQDNEINECNDIRGIKNST